MPVPKRKQSKMRTRRRRSVHDKITAKNVIACDNCGALKLSHRVCLSCGQYKSRQIIPVVER
jgi:large subunit ribosomal protein L32